jgi:hypothetical protein
VILLVNAKLDFFIILFAMAFEIFLWFVFIILSILFGNSDDFHFSSILFQIDFLKNIYHSSFVSYSLSSSITLTFYLEDNDFF